MSDTLQLTVTYDEPDEDGWIVARVVRVPGTMSQGRTREEARENVIDAPSHAQRAARASLRSVKRRDLERHLTTHGARKVAEGGTHSKWRSADGARATAVPRLSRDGRGLVRAICAQLEIPAPPQPR